LLPIVNPDADAVTVGAVTVPLDPDTNAPVYVDVLDPLLYSVQAYDVAPDAAVQDMFAVPDVMERVGEAGVVRPADGAPE